MQYAATRSCSFNSWWIVLLKGMPCLSYITLLNGHSTMHLGLLELQQTRGCCISCLRLCIYMMRERQRWWVCQHLLLRGGNGGHWPIAHSSILISYVLLIVFFLSPSKRGISATKCLLTKLIRSSRFDSSMSWALSRHSAKCACDHWVFLVPNVHLHLIKPCLKTCGSNLWAVKWSLSV